MNSQIGKNGMKHLILILLAAFALPTTVNADSIEKNGQPEKKSKSNSSFYFLGSI